ncbi:hypothetical protein HELRODRAFT_124357, partial [Helobdella robusta]|uniref:WH1 domain-containing protein n=1 Tax=Helobdella robusta TaxID=6412 RepID=T1EH11_HELRO
HLTEHDLLQVETFYKGHKTEVYVSTCMAAVFLSSSGCNSNWTFHKEGIPVFVLDSGESRRQKRLHIVLAEKGTAFPMWRDVLTHLSQYRIGQEPNFHIMNSSKDHSKHVGIRFYDAMSANLFYSHYVRITNDGEDDVLDLSNSRKKMKSKTGNRHSPKSANKLAFKKSDISQPCCFTHITKI